MGKHLRTLPLTLALALGATATGVLFAPVAVGAAASPPCSPIAGERAGAGVLHGVPDHRRLRRDAEAVSALGIPAVQARATAGPITCSARVGVADVRTGRDIPADGAFRIASTSKALTATVVLQLVGEGRLGLDDRIERWLPGLVAGRAITIRQVLQHTSGLPDAIPSWNTEAEYLKLRYQRYSTRQLVEDAVAMPKLFEPGEGWAYSNTGYLIAELIIERVTGQPWAAEFERRIFRPLGMDHTYWPGSSPDIRLPHALQYQRFHGKLVDVTSQIPAYPAGGIVSTTRDLDVFFRALLGGRLLRPAELAAMKSTRPVDAALQKFWPGGEYGLGLVSRPLTDTGDERYWGHDGGDSGSIVTTGFAEDGRRGAVVSMNFGLDATFEETLAQQRAADRVVRNVLRPPRR
ncbi:serine hydrolase domain-containing protein [Embleya sp. NPDC020630]|uniref:serine hydrolase domain-containing protein n=1 Tax=Embleya sp. NPDC020630 TaxID=3363979 RepID=UPI0037B6415A